MPACGLSGVVLTMAVLYGVCMGSFAVSGGLGVAFLLQTLHRLTLASQAAPPVSDDAPVEAEVVEERGVLERPDSRTVSRQVRTVVRCWVVVFALVGAQMAWVLRPFVGALGAPVQFFREDGWGNAYTVVARLIRDAVAL